MTVVVDASLLIAAVTNDDRYGEWAQSALEMGGLVSTSMLLAEAANGLRNMVLRGEVAAAEAAPMLDDLLQRDLEIDLHPFVPYARRVWQLRDNLTAYDAWYVAIAESLGCPLYTMDAAMGRAPGPACDIVVPPRA